MPKKRARPPSAPVYELRVTLRDIKPPIWRQLLIAGSASLHDVHRALQESFGWQDSHLYEFAVGGREFESPADDEATGEDSTAVSLLDLGLKKGDKLTYTYDFGDDWIHDIEVRGTRPHEPDAEYPCCLDGARAGPPEDCGGPFGYAELIEILANPKHPEFTERREWVGKRFQPEVFDLRATNRILMLAFEEDP